MDNHNSLEEIKSVIDNNTFTINFYKQWSGDECQQFIWENGATITGIVKDIQWGTFIKKPTKHQGMKKKIIKIEIGGDISSVNNGFIVGTSLSKSRFLNLLEAIALNNDLNNCILIIENNTCAGMSALPEQVCKCCLGDCSENDKIENVVRNYMKEKKIDNNTFYFGNRYDKSFNDNDPRFPEQYGADYMQRIEGNKCDTFDIYEKKATGEDGCFTRGEKIEKNENEYYSSLYQDLQNLQNSQQTSQNNNVSPQMNNNQHNIPTYQSGMGNNKYNFGIQNLDSLNINSLQIQRQSDAVNNNQNGDNINASMSFDSNEFCNLTNCTCCGYKLCNPE